MVYLRDCFEDVFCSALMMRYLGNKESLLGDIHSLLEEKDLLREGYVFFDCFCGTGTVSASLKNTYQIILNDTLKSSATYAKAQVIAEQCDFQKLGFDPIAFLNKSSDSTKGFFFSNYSLGGSNRMYFSEENAGRIDFFRDQIEEWFKESLISIDEYDYLLGSLLLSVSRVANVAGVYGAFLKHWDKRALQPIEFTPIPRSLFPSKKTPIVYNEKIEDIIADIDCDILYLDPPYTQNQYGTQYHLLETLILNDNPSLSKVTGSRPTTPLRSKWSQAYHSHILFDYVIANTKAKHIIMSYSKDGFMSRDYIEAVLKRYGDEESYDCKIIDYKKYTNTKSRRSSNHEEYLFYIQKKDKNEIVIESPLNYPGSKAKMVNQIKRILPKGYNTFIDAFGGGFNVGINIESEHIIYNEINHFVVEIIKSFSDFDTYEYLQKIFKLIEQYDLNNGSKQGYLSLRKTYNSHKTRPVEMLYTLILYGFQQQIRFNSKHEFNNPHGSRHFNERLLAKFISFARVIKTKDVVFEIGPYWDMGRYAKQGSLFYFDPPYNGTTGVYNDGKRGFLGWSPDQETRMLGFIEQINERGALFILSYINTEEIKKWAEAHNFNTISVSQPQGKYSNREEILIINF